MLWKPLNVVVKSLDVQQLGRSLQNYCGNKAKAAGQSVRGPPLDYCTNTRGGQLC
jgi:hypothetical protein